MKALRIVLTAIFFLLSGVGVVAVVLGKAPFGSLVLVMLYITCGLALNGRGGWVARYVALGTSGLLCFGLTIGAIYAGISSLFGAPMDPFLLVASLVFALIGGATLFCIMRNKKVMASVS